LKASILDRKRGSHPFELIFWFKGCASCWFCIEIRNNHWKCEFRTSRSIKNINFDVKSMTRASFKPKKLIRRSANVPLSMNIIPQHYLHLCNPLFHLAHPSHKLPGFSSNLKTKWGLRRSRSSKGLTACYIQVNHICWPVALRIVRK
jgi:hypothetical protein